MSILAVAFVGWLVFEGINDMRGGNVGGDINPVVGEVAGNDIRYNDWNSFHQNQLAVMRQTGRVMTDEDLRIVENQAWESLINATLLEGELDRLGIQVTDSEVRQAFFTQPPQEMMSHAAFQTDGQFDIDKYRRFFTDPSTDETQLLQIENYYRSLLPRAKLQALVESGIYVSDEEAWEFFRDTNETARVRFVNIDPSETVPDTAITVSDSEIRTFYNEHREEFIRPASARTNLISIALRPSQTDTASALKRATSLAERVRAGEMFEDVAANESGDTISAVDGGFMGHRARTELNPALANAAYAARIGEVTDPVETPFGFHILRVDSRTTDSLSLRQIYIPIEMSPATEDSIFDFMDELEGIALAQGLATAADSLDSSINLDVQLTAGVSFVPGVGALGVAPDWALEPETEIGEISRFWETPTGFHVFELLGRSDEGEIPLQEVTPNIRTQLLIDKKKERAAEIINGQLTNTPIEDATLEAAATTMEWTVEETTTFRRGDFVPGLGQGTEAIGEAFGSVIGIRSNVVDAGDAIAVIEVLEHHNVTRTEFENVKEALLLQLRFERAQQYVQRWMAALRAEATVEDHRALLNNPSNADSHEGHAH